MFLLFQLSHFFLRSTAICKLFLTFAIFVGILQKGDGSNIYLKHKPRVILTTMGDGHQRPLDCNDCEGQASKQRLLAPVALAASSDGSVFVGDFNLVRKIMTDGTVKTLVRLK